MNNCYFMTYLATISPKRKKGKEVKTRKLNNPVVCGVFITLSMVILSTYRDALFCVMLLFLGYQIHFQKLL